MKTPELYKSLIKHLEAGEQAMVVSTYTPDGDVSERLILNSNQADWQAMQLLKKSDGAGSEGSVSHLLNESGELTLIEHYHSQPRLIILGAGHISLALAKMAELLDWQTLIYDDRPAFANRRRFPEATEVICDSFEQLYQRVEINAHDYVVIVTRGHKHDQASLEGLLRGIEPAYTGMIGSRRRIAIVFDQLQKQGFADERLKRVHSPIGLRIGAVTPAEIAVAIIAEIIAVKRLERGEGEGASGDLEAIQTLAADADARTGNFANNSPTSPGSSPDASANATHLDALITIYDTQGSTPSACGAKLGMRYDGSIVGTIGGGCAESDALQAAREMLRSQRNWTSYMVDMTDSAEEDGMVCGGEMRVVIERVG